MNKPKTTAAVGASRPGAAPATSPPRESVRESVEAIIIAMILTLTFRTLLGENYQIPTGSMAPTLQGRHMDLTCIECGYQYRTGASVENQEDGHSRGTVIGTTCPICRFPFELDKVHDLNQRSFGGDRIIVSKVAYVFNDPQRWDVFVFKYPGNPKINYIKRLVGLPGETLRIRHGDVFTRDPVTASLPPAEQRFQIARKPADKVSAMLQVVDDSNHLSASLIAAGWPSRWAAFDNQGEAWQASGDGAFHVPVTEEAAWLGYRHLVPRDEDWTAVVENRRPDLSQYYGQLITDYYEYNDSYPAFFSRTAGLNWVGDLAVEAQVEVASAQGEVLLDLVEGGIHHQCRIDIATGQARVMLDQGRRKFSDLPGQESAEAVASTALRGLGTYVVRFANVDDQLFLWVDGEPAKFNGPTTFNSPPSLSPQWSEAESSDLVPLRIGAQKAELRVRRLRVLRDVYYIATSAHDQSTDSDYGGRWEGDSAAIVETLTDPRRWGTTDLFASRQDVSYRLSSDQFFPMGDNSPQSKDARLWSYLTAEGEEKPPPYVQRDMLIGKAVFIYWPHSWNFPKVPFIIPNFQRIGLIR